MRGLRPLLGMLALMAAGCGSEAGLSTAEVQSAAKERVRGALRLTPESALFANVFVGEPVNGDTVLCGTVSGKRADGTEITPRRFVAATEPARWLKFDPAAGLDLPSQPAKFIEWHTRCAGEQEVR